MSLQGVDLASGIDQVDIKLSWEIPHARVVVLLVGPDEVPFTIHKDLLCIHSGYFRTEFAKDHVDKVEYIVKFPETLVNIFGCFQNFIYTGKVYDKDGGKEIPDYSLLMGLWKLATQLCTAHLKVAVLNTMIERRRLTSRIPGTSLLIQAWKETEEGSGLRKLLIDWAAEHLRATPSIRMEFTKALPQEILSELVVAMSDLPADLASPQATIKHQNPDSPVDAEPEPPRKTKRVRRSGGDINSHTRAADTDFKVPVKKTSRKSDATPRPRRRTSTSATLNPEQDMDYCRGLIERMASGRGYWGRLVRPFRHPVDPVIDGVPDYFDIIKIPMDLNTIKTKMTNGVYKTSAEFEADVRLIFENCYQYWAEEDPIWKAAKEFNTFFDNMWADRHKYKGPKNWVNSEAEA